MTADSEGGGLDPASAEPSARSESTELQCSVAEETSPPIPILRTPDGSPADLRPQLLDSGWFQGAVLPPELAAHIQMVPGADALPSEDDWPEGPWCIVVSQDCDLVYGDCVAEPVAEIVIATPIKQCSQKCERLRNPRELHVRLTKADGTVQPVSIEVRNRGFVNRALLLTARPAKELLADATTVRWIAGLVAQRYLRSARPEAFDRRFRKARRKIIELLDAEATVLLDVLLGIEPRGELGPDDRYAVSIYAVLQDAFGDTPRSSQQKKRNKIHEALRQAMLPCKDEGIDVEIIDIKTRYDISIREYDDLLPMDLGQS